MTTENHGYQTADEHETEWHIPVLANWESFDRDIELRIEETNLVNKTPYVGTKALATDTGVVYLGDGENWQYFATLTAREHQTQNETGDGTADQFTFTHDLGTDPEHVRVTPASAAATDAYLVETTGVDYTLGFPDPPADGVALDWEVELTTTPTFTPAGDN